MGIGMGSIMPPSFQAATLGVPRSSAGAASAMVSTSQQVGGAIGTAVLNTIAATAATAYVADHQPAGPDVIAAGAIHSFSVAYTWSAGIFLLGAILTASLFRTRADRAARLEAAAPAAAGRRRGARARALSGVRPAPPPSTTGRRRFAVRWCVKPPGSDLSMTWSSSAHRRTACETDVPQSRSPG